MDTATLFLLAGVMLISLPIALWGALGPRKRRLAHVRYWCGGGVVLGLGAGLVGLRNVAPGPVAISLAIALVCCGLLIRWQALRDILSVGTSAGGARAKAVIAWNRAEIGRASCRERVCQYV